MSPGVQRDDEVSAGSLVNRARDAAHELIARLAAAQMTTEEAARRGAVGTGAPHRGVEHPDHVIDRIPTVDRAFAFLDLCGFTRFTATHGEHQAIEALRT